MYENYQQYFNLMGINSFPALSLFLALIIWSIIWKGIALWKAAQNNSKIWYIVMLVVNTMGILEIIYIFFFANRRKAE